MKRRWRRLIPAATCAVLALGADLAQATSIQDLVRIKGHERNLATGLGIVIGLDGTGDTSKDSYVAARPFAALLSSLGNHVESLDELEKADSFAIVQVTLQIPATGAREGDRLDVSVGALYNAKSLAGGRLVFSPLRLPGPDSADAPVLAFAEGALVIEADNPRSAVVRGGGQMLTDIRNLHRDLINRQGAITLVLDDQYAGYPVAAMIAQSINDEFAVDGFTDLAVVEDAKNIRVIVPEPDRERPANFIALLMTIPIDAALIQTPARIVINEKEGIILVTGNVEIGPVAITHPTLTISSITPPPESTEPGARTTNWAGLDTTDRRSRASTRLVDLLRAFDQLNFPASDKIAIIYELKRTGQLHAEIVHR